MVDPKAQLSNASKTVVVGMSGGVDSSVTAALLKEQGYRVIGLFMKNWEETGPDDQCTSAQDWADVQRVCEGLDIPHYAVNFAKEYWEGVFAQFLREYQQGYTPNPDILCNREIKFKVFFEKAMQLGADYLATGHYCQRRLDPATGRYQLVKGTDPGKDQTYFLYAIDGAVLDRVLFPIGDIHKSEVRKLAEKYDLATQTKKDSTGICFIGERDFTQFLSQYVQAKPGAFRLLDGTKVGTHQGAAFYTPGQRKGLGLGGQGEPWFVVGKDSARNLVFVERGEKHPALYADELWATDITWIDGRGPAQIPFRCRAKLRYRQADQDCTIESVSSDGRMHVTFPEPQRAITPRQSIVFYQDDICLGGAMIEKPGPSHWERAQRG
jgi:tRNA-specific 2-thiouridylase